MHLLEKKLAKKKLAFLAKVAISVKGGLIHREMEIDYLVLLPRRLPLKNAQANER